MKFNVEDVVQFARSRKAVADQIIQGLVNPAAPAEDVELPAEGITAEQWREAGGVTPLAKNPGVPMREAPQVLNVADQPVSGPLDAAELKQPEVYRRPAHIQIAMDFLKKKGTGEDFSETPYPDGVDKKTKAQLYSIGYGSQTDPRTGQPVNMVTAPITEDEAILAKERRLHEDDRKLDKLLTVPVTPSKRAALLSLMYNIGSEAFSTSSVLKAVNDEAPVDELWKALRQYNVGTWKDKKGNVHRGPMKGLDKRRKAEHRLMKMPTPPEE